MFVQENMALLLGSLYSASLFASSVSWAVVEPGRRAFACWLGFVILHLILTKPNFSLPSSLEFCWLLKSPLLWLDSFTKIRFVRCTVNAFSVRYLISSEISSTKRWLTWKKRVLRQLLTIFKPWYESACVSYGDFSLTVVDSMDPMITSRSLMAFLQVANRQHE